MRDFKKTSKDSLFSEGEQKAVSDTAKHLPSMCLFSIPRIGVSRVSHFKSLRAKEGVGEGEAAGPLLQAAQPEPGPICGAVPPR